MSTEVRTMYEHSLHSSDNTKPIENLIFTVFSQGNRRDSNNQFGNYVENVENVGYWNHWCSSQTDIYIFQFIRWAPLLLLSVPEVIQESHSLNDAVNIFPAAISLKVIADSDKILIFSWFIFLAWCKKFVVTVRMISL